MHTKEPEKGRFSLGPMVDLLGDVVGFLNDPEADSEPDCEILFSNEIAGFHYPKPHLTGLLRHLVKTAADENDSTVSLILTCLVTEESRVHFSVVSPFGTFAGLGRDELLDQLNGSPDRDSGIKETPNTPFWRGGTVDEEADLLLEPLPLGGTRATIVFPEARIAWRDGSVSPDR